MTALRIAVFLRDGGRCTKCGRRIVLEPYSMFQEDAMHLSHKQNKRNYGDTLQNCVAKCKNCHLVLEHMGGKVVPKKERV
jgi:5-methylcytosine-specific restriction endonuclease McrA